MRSRNYYFIFSFLMVVLVSCGQNYGNKLESKELDVYFSNSAVENLARKLGKYWKENNLLGAKKQFLRLDKSSNFYSIHLIHSGQFKVQNMSFDERKLLKQLQDSLQKNVFSNNEVHVLICDEQFNPLYDINN
jgi:hypothetical protein